MTVLALVLTALASAAPLLAPTWRRWVADPVAPVAVMACALLGAAAATAAAGDPVDGWLGATASVIGVVAATTAGSVVVRAVFRLTRGELLPFRHGYRRRRATASEGVGATQSEPATAGVDATPGTPATEGVTDARGEPESVLRGGAWIGYLERAAVSATVLASWPEGIALVLAVKGVGRYAELRENNAPEAFIIGTFASLLWACAAAGVAHLATH